MDCFEMVSLCEILPKNQKGEQYAKRIADLRNNNVVKFDGKSNQNNSDIKERRLDELEVIYLKEKNPNVGELIVLKWSAEPNIKGNGKLFTKYELDNYSFPLEIVELKDAKTNKELSQIICSGISLNNHFNDFFVCKNTEFETSKSEIECYLIGRDCYKKEDGMIKLSPDVYCLEKYKLQKQMIINLGEDNRKFYTSMVLDIKLEERPKIRSDNYILGCELRKFLSWPVGKQIGLCKNEWRKIADYIECNIDGSDFLTKISNLLGCPSENAKDVLMRFLKNEGDKLENNEFNISIYESIVENSSAIKEKWIKLVSEKFSEQIEKKKQMMQLEIDELKELEINKQKECNNLEKEISKLKSEIDSCIKQRNDVVVESKKVTQQFEMEFDRFKQSVVDYVSEMAIDDYFTNIIKRKKYLKEYSFENKECHEIVENEEVIYCLSKNMEKIGFCKEITVSFSAWLLAAIRTKTPLLLAGPNAQNIADAVSMSLFARKAAVFHCEGEPTREAIRQIEDAESEVIAIHHALQSKWTDYLPEMLAIPKKHFLVIHPFVEDLQIEPKSLYSYMFPIFTEVLTKYQIENSNFDDFHASIVSGELLCLKNENATKYDRVIRNLKLAGQFVNTKMRTLCGEFYWLMNYVGEKDIDEYVYMFCILPFAYVTGQLDKVKNKLDKKPNDSECCGTKFLERYNEFVNLYCGEDE